MDGPGQDVVVIDDGSPVAAALAGPDRWVDLILRFRFNRTKQDR
ncbi:MAG: hypothetical protein ACRDRC_07385 [Pseudonocardiaceae bacterium]